MTDVSNDERFERYRDAIWGEANTNAAVGAVMAVADAEIASAKAAAWDEGANAAVRPFVKDARATLDAVIPFPDNPHRADMSWVSELVESSRDAADNYGVRRLTPPHG